MILFERNIWSSSPTLRGIGLHSGMDRRQRDNGEPQTQASASLPSFLLSGPTPPPTPQHRRVFVEASVRKVTLVVATLENMQSETRWRCA